MHLFDQRAKHAFGNLEIGDDAVLHRTDRLNVTVRAADHRLRFAANGDDLLRSRIECDDRWLVQDDAFALHIDEGVGSPKIDSDICAE